MGFTKTAKFWDAYKHTSTRTAFIREVRKFDPDADPVVLNAVWHAFDLVAEDNKGQPRPLARERLNDKGRAAGRERR